ncbi:hypothetical protein VM1G_06306 [Cytospora mali]|uniref:Major facilitator superfamily (MFS) profile domain-containing protein n=1 Tax=Cytospora mali TaxID=578113 RepID=A0A194W163_CYTMA|nr:hypothetical protein VM1G_06306 [Valsa mali]
MAPLKQETEHRELQLKPAFQTISESNSDHDFQHHTRTVRRVITEQEAWEHTAHNYKRHRKRSILVILWMIQIAMNMNGSLWANTEAGLSSYYNFSIHKVSLGNMAFLISYAFGCEVWAPWSQELGRKWLMQSSLLLVSILTAVIPFAPNFTTVIILRLLTGLATACSSLTLGVVADIYKANEQQNAVAFVAWGSMLGSSLPPMESTRRDFAATANPSYGHFAWIGTGVGVFSIGIANYNIYASTIDYMVASYGLYAASATRGNGFARDFLAGVLTPVGRV